jgi:HK97 family phage prohead protease
MDTNHIRAFSLLEVKAFDEDAREITGMATTPDPDRMGDIVDPMGAKFAAELPLLWQHRHDAPVGIVKFGKPTKQGIPFRASVAKIETAGVLKDMVDLAWQSVKEKLVRGVSIGFRALEYAFMDNGGVRFTEIEIYELSLVTIPANAAATIQTIKAMDTAGRLNKATCGVPLIRTTPEPTAKADEGSVKLLATSS